MNTNEKNQNTTVTNLPVADGGLEKVRDLLFGDQVRDFSQQIDGLRESLDAGVSALRTETATELASLEKSRTESESLISTNLAHESQARSEQAQSLDTALTDMGVVLGDRIDSIEHQLSEQIKGVHTVIEQQMEDMETRLEVKFRELTSSLDSESQRLEQQKVGRADLSSLFGQIAEQLNAK